MKNNNTFVRLLHKKDSDTTLYIIGIVVGLSILLVVGMMTLISSLTHFAFPKGCMFKAMFGLYCPGCGGTRAFTALLQGDLITSVTYHPFVVYAVILTLVFYISQTLRYLTDEKVRGIHFRTIYIYIGIILLVLNFLQKNISII